MLSRPSFSIRRLIPQRKPDSPEGKDGPFDSGDKGKESRSRTWPVGNRKGPIPTIDLRRTEDSHRIIVLPPLPDTPNSWTGSYHSFCNDTSFTSPRSSPTPPSSSSNWSPLRSPNRTPQTSPQRSPPKSPLLTPRQLDDSPRSRRSSLVSASSNQPPPSTSVPSSWPPQQLEDEWPLPALVGPQDLLGHTDDGARTQWLSDDEGSSQRSHEECAQHTARGANDSFHRKESLPAVNRLFPLRLAPAPDTTVRSAVAKRASLARRTSQRTSQSSSKSGRSVTKVPLRTTHSAAPKRLSSVARTKKQRQKKIRPRPRVGVTGPKWAFPEGAKDLFAIRIFNRVEADEMLPESVLQEIRMSRATQARLAKKTGGIDTDSDARPIEFEKPFFNEAPSPTVPLVQHHLPPKTEGDDTTPRPPPTLRPRHEDRPALPQQTFEPAISNVEERETMRLKAFFRGQGQHREAPAPAHPPPLPPKNPHRRLPPKQTPPLPTIPEIVPTDSKFFLPPLPPQNFKLVVENVEPTRPLPPPPQQRRRALRVLKTEITGPVRDADATTCPADGVDEAGRSSDETLRPGDECHPDDKAAHPGDEGARSRDKPDGHDHLYIKFPSTRLTPRLIFRHGDIFLTKADFYKAELAEADDNKIEKIDVTIYQTAIQGGAGDLLDEVVDYTRPSEAETQEYEELLDWFAGWGFQGPGALVTAGDVAVAKSLQVGVPCGFTRFDPLERVRVPVQYRNPPEMTLGREGQWGKAGPPPPPPPPYHSNRSPPPSVTEMQEVGVPGFKDYYLQQRRSPLPTMGQRFQEQPRTLPAAPQQQLHLQTDTATTATAATGSSSTWRASAISLPQSPMLDIVVSQDARGNEYVVPPMGFNLGHDLGDFLKWEADNVWATGYYGTSSA